MTDFNNSAATIAALKRENETLRAENTLWKAFACTDVLTDIANVRGLRTWLTSRAPRSENEEYYLRIIAIDLNDFKEANDAQGHAVGDAMLQKVGRALRRFFSGDNVLAARVGGDEFIVAQIYDEVDIKSDDSAVASAFRQALEDKCISVAIGETVGVVTGWGNNLEQQFCELRPEADRAMYADKAQAKQAA